MSRPIRTKIIGLTLRFATVDDVPVILELIKELADYLTKPVGFLLFFHNFSTFLGRPGIYIEDIYIRPEHRGMGIGKTILSYIATLAVERDCGRLEWYVPDWNMNALNFYNDLGAQAMDEWTVFRISGDILSNLSGEF